MNIPSEQIIASPKEIGFTASDVRRLLEERKLTAMVMVARLTKLLHLFVIGKCDR